MNISALLNTLTTHAFSLPVVILYVTAGCNLRCITCSFRDPLPNEMRLDEYRKLARVLAALGLRHIVFSGGEPLLRKDMPDICRFFESPDIRQSLLTNGLLLEKRYPEMHGVFSEIIVSLDGPDAETHNTIRGIRSFDQIIRGIRAVLSDASRPRISFRTVIQRRNFRSLPAMVEFARSLGVDRISFLAADVLTDSFNRANAGKVVPDEAILLSPEETVEFKDRIDSMVETHRSDFARNFISESPKRMKQIVQYFEAFHGRAPFPPTTCNAPMVSTVITSTGELLPCYFLPSFGNLRSGSLGSQLNSDSATAIRRDVRACVPERCRTCVCTLHISPASALADRF
ncbi:MAG: radical SAM/SPASM domain-containing protein [Bacteroidota bacterium]